MCEGYLGTLRDELDSPIIQHRDQISLPEFDRPNESLLYCASRVNIHIDDYFALVKLLCRWRTPPCPANHTYILDATLGQAEL